MDRPSYRTARLKVTDRDPMTDFERREMTLLGTDKRVYVSGSGPAVIVMAEMPGIYAHVVRFARIVRDAGFTVWMPALFGTEGGPVTAGGALKTMARACVSKEFRAFAANKSSPVTQWLRALAAHVHPLCGGKGVGAIGMCFTGNFGDKFCKAERLAAHEAALGDRFVGRVLKDDTAPPDTPVSPHSVVTLHLIDEAGAPTRQAVDEILAFYALRLRANPATERET